MLLSTFLNFTRKGKSQGRGATGKRGANKVWIRWTGEEPGGSENDIRKTNLSYTSKEVSTHHLLGKKRREYRGGVIKKGACQTGRKRSALDGGMGAGEKKIRNCLI